MKVRCPEEAEIPSNPPSRSLKTPFTLAIQERKDEREDAEPDHPSDCLLSEHRHAKDFPKRDEKSVVQRPEFLHGGLDGSVDSEITIFHTGGNIARCGLGYVPVRTKRMWRPAEFLE